LSSIFTVHDNTAYHALINGKIPLPLLHHPAKLHGVLVHDWPQDAIGQAVPYGVYDIGANRA